MGVIWTDVNNDGRFDLYVSNMYSNAGNRVIGHNDIQDLDVQAKFLNAASGNSLFLNMGDDAPLDDVSEKFGVQDGGWAWGAQAFDYDRDGDEDILQLNGFITGTTDYDL